MKPDGKLRPDRLYQAWVYQAEPSTARKEMVLYYLGSRHGVPTPSPVGYIPHLKEQNYPYKAAILGGGIVEHAGRPYSQHIFDLALPELLHRTAVNVSRLIASMHVRMTFLKPQIQAFDVNLNVIKPGDQITSLYSAALNLQVNNPILTKLSQLFNVLYVKQTSPIIIGHRDLHTGNLVTSSMGGSESLAEYAFIDWGDAGERRWGGDLLDFFVHHKREAVKANPQYEKYYSLEPIDAYVRKFNEEADNFGLEERVSFSRLSQADMRNLLIDSLTINAFEMIDPMRRNIGDIMNKAIYHGKRIIKDLDSLSSYGCREIAQEILLFYRCLFEYLSRRKEGPGIHNYGYMVDVFGKIGLRRGPGYTFLPQIFRHES
jgi:hypothetical protein